jgi:hypothetical protein
MSIPAGTFACPKGADYRAIAVTETPSRQKSRGGDPAIIVKCASEGVQLAGVCRDEGLLAAVRSGATACWS